MPLIGRKPYAAVKCFWVEADGEFLVRIRKSGAADYETLGLFKTEAEADAAKDKAWEEFDLEGSSMSPCYRLPDGRQVTSGELPPGAMYDAKHLHDHLPMEDGITLSVVLPNGCHWCVDSRAGNCTRPDDREHTCWVRRGNPRTGMVHVERRPGDDTCSAGHNSIASLPQDDPHHYHGHLQFGVLTAG